MVAERRINRRSQSLNDPRAISTNKSTSSSRVRKHHERIGEQATLGRAKSGIHIVVKEITKVIAIMKETGYPDFPLQQLKDAIPKDIPMLPIIPVRVENPLALPNLLMPTEEHSTDTFPKPIEAEIQENAPTTNQHEDLDPSAHLPILRHPLNRLVRMNQVQKKERLKKSMKKSMRMARAHSLICNIPKLWTLKGNPGQRRLAKHYLLGPRQ